MSSERARETDGARSVGATRVAAHWRNGERLRFLVIGGWNTLFGYLAFVALYALLHDHVHYLVVGAVAHVVAVVNAFVAHRRLVFRSRGAWWPEFVRFNVAQSAMLGLGLVGLWLLVDEARLAPPAAQALVMVVTVTASYVLHRWFTFAAPR